MGLILNDFLVYWALSSIGVFGLLFILFFIDTFIGGDEWIAQYLKNRRRKKDAD